MTDLIQTPGKFPSLGTVYYPGVISGYRGFCSTYKSK